MTWYADLGPIDYFRSAGSASWRAVGWLGAGHPFAQGEVSDESVRRLEALMSRAKQPLLFLGSHECDLRPVTGKRRAAESYNLWVPRNGVIYVAPYLILHDIGKHRYRPPDEFIDAVLSCPDTNTADYQAAIRSIDPHFGGR